MVHDGRNAIVIPSQITVSAIQRFSASYLASTMLANRPASSYWQANEPALSPMPEAAKADNLPLLKSEPGSAQSLCCRSLFVYSTTRLRGLVADRFGYKATMDLDMG